MSATRRLCSTRVLLLASSLVAAASSARPAATGAVRGTITGTIIEPENTVVYLEPLDGQTFKLKPKTARLSQKGARFQPAVLPIVKGSSVDMTNDDWIEHSVYSMSLIKVFDLGLYQNKERKTVKFDKAGRAELGCSIHPHMSAVVLVLETPFFTRPDPRGTFTFENVPPGAYRVVLYRFEQPEQSLEINIPAQGVVSAAFRVDGAP